MIINHQVVTTWLARGGQAIATQGQIASGYMNIGRQARGMTRETSLAEKQMRAFGTTLRYAFAGSVIFGMTSMIGKLNELQQQMGLIAAIAGPSGVNFGTSGLAQLQDQLAVKSVEARTNITDLNNSVINYLSTVQGADPKQLPEIVSAIGIAARLSQTPTEDLTKAVTTLNIAAGRHNNIKTINSLLREWFSLISRAPGGISAAPQIAQQLGPLASVAQMGRLDPEQLFGFSLGALRFGATPSVALRGTQYFLQSLFRPPSKAAREEMGKAGLTPELLDKVGGTEFARQYLSYVKSLGARPTRAGVKKFGTMADVMPNTEAVPGDEFAPNLNIPGLNAQAREFLGTTLGRIHGIRTALVLLQDPKLLDQFITSFSDLEKGVGPHAKQLKEAADRYRRETPLQEAAIALDSMRTTIARDLSGPLGLFAGGISGGAQALTSSSGLRHKLEIGGLAAAGAYGLYRAGKGMGMGGLLGKGIVGTAAVESISKSGVAPLGTFLDPLFVVVLGGGGGGFGGGRGLPPVFDPRRSPSTGNAGKLGRLGQWAKRFAPGLAGLGGPEIAAIMAAYFGTDFLLDQAGFNPSIGDAVGAVKRIPMGPDLGRWDIRHLGRGRSHGANMGEWWKMQVYANKTGMSRKYGAQFPYLTGLMGLPEGNFMRTKYKDVIDQAMNPKTDLGALERSYKQMMKHPFATPAIQDALRKGQNPFGGSVFGLGTSTMAGNELVLNIRIIDPKGRVTRVAVPPQFRNGKGPSSRGRRKTYRMEGKLPSWMPSTWERGQGGR